MYALHWELKTVRGEPLTARLGGVGVECDTHKDQSSEGVQSSHILVLYLRSSKSAITPDSTTLPCRGSCTSNRAITLANELPWFDPCARAYPGDWLIDGPLLLFAVRQKP